MAIEGTRRSEDWVPRFRELALHVPAPIIVAADVLERPICTYNPAWHKERNGYTKLKGEARED